MTNMHISSLHEHVAAWKILKASKIGPAMAWATGPAPPALELLYMLVQFNVTNAQQSFKSTVGQSEPTAA